ncbi:hypothetical protein SDC49_14685 [Lactobacillus sp. R2/2]|nr:hypothetical protein [Lactobacillus sp. R2/2]MEB3364426.1 hypothetical protein [Lactobacillus sp. R2/2]
MKISDDWFTVEGQTAGSKILVSGKLSSSQLKQLNYGYKVILHDLSGEVNPIEPASNYGEFDQQKYYRSKKITQQVNLTSFKIQIKKGGLASYLHYWRFQLKKFLQKFPPILFF